MPHTIYDVIFDATKIVNHFGGIAATRRALSAIGMDVKYKTIQRQRDRGSMPGEMVASLLLASYRIDKPLDLTDCLLVRPSEDEDGKADD